MSSSKIRLRQLAHGRSGDKGSDVNIGIIARDTEAYRRICRDVTAERVRDFFQEVCAGKVVRYELPNLNALNFILKGALGSGGSSSLRSDAQGKAFAEMLLHMEMAD
jgi:hypothetical protein